MTIFLPFLFFVIIAVMRVVQNLCAKTASNIVNNRVLFFKYSTLYYFVASGFSFISLFIVGFYGFNGATVLCAFISSALFATDFLASLEAIKGCSLVVSSMFSLGGLIISVVVSYFWFNEGVSIFQLMGLALFFVAAYLLSANTKTTVKKISLKTFILLILKFLSNGFIQVVQKYFSLRVENGNVALYSMLTFVLSGTVMAIGLIVMLTKEKTLLRQTETAVKFKMPKMLVICGCSLAFAIFIVNLLVTEMGKTVSSVILFPVSSAISIIITTVVGFSVYKEKLRIRDIIGLILGLLSIIVISVLNPDFLSTIR